MFQHLLGIVANLLPNHLSCSAFVDSFIWPAQGFWKNDICELWGFKWAVEEEVLRRILSQSAIFGAARYHQLNFWLCHNARRLCQFNLWPVTFLFAANLLQADQRICCKSCRCWRLWRCARINSSDQGYAGFKATIRRLACCFSIDQFCKSLFLQPWLIDNWLALVYCLQRHVSEVFSIQAANGYTACLCDWIIIYEFELLEGYVMVRATLFALHQFTQKFEKTQRQLRLLPDAGARTFSWFEQQLQT